MFFRHTVTLQILGSSTQFSTVDPKVFFAVLTFGIPRQKEFMSLFIKDFF